MSIKITDVNLMFGMDGNIKMTVDIPMREKAKCLELADSVKRLVQDEKPIIMTIEREKQTRSLDANAYCWVLCGKIAEKLNITKEEVYQKAIKEVGVYRLYPIKDDEVKYFISQWKSIGIGFLAEEWQPCKMEGYTYITAYYGSHTYDSAQMARLIDDIVMEAQELDIETKTPDEIAHLKSLWGEK